MPGLAESWMISPDGTEYTFSLRRDVRFHDGTRFDAQAVRANIEYTLNPDHHSQKAAFMLGPFDRVEIADDFTVVLILDGAVRPAARFALAGLPRHGVAQGPGGVGTGGLPVPPGRHGTVHVSSTTCRMTT